MADFVAVLRKTLDGLGETTPETRARVYDKARSTVAAKLAAINPPPPAAVADRQKKALEDAISVIESEFTPAKPAFDDPLDELESVFAALKEGKPIASAAKTVAPKPQVNAPAPQATPPAVEAATAKSEPATAPKPAVAPNAVAAPQARTAPQIADNEDFDALAPEERPYEEYQSRERRRGYSAAIVAVLVLLIVAGGGYGIWLNKDEFSRIVGLDGMLGTSGTPTAEQLASEPPAAPAEKTEVAAAPAEDEQPNSQQAPEEAPKFTQRLNADGTEVDAGPAGGEQTFGEGTSVAALTTPVAADQAATPPPVSSGAPAVPAATPPAVAAPPSAAAGTPTGDAAPAATPPASVTPPADAAAPGSPATPAPPAATAATAPVETTPAANPAPAQVAVGQRAIFYEERTNVAQGSAEPGSIVWSEVQESPGGDAPPEPAIRAEATIPGKNIQLRMTIRRNGDKTLPASHIIEMIFLTPDGFEGGGIDNVLRVALKSSEQDAGNPLVGIPAKIADGFFLVALNDSQNEITANLNLLKRQGWIDIPIVYKNGRRALFTMEKGIPGEKVFNDAIAAWQPKTAG